MHRRRCAGRAAHRGARRRLRLTHRPSVGTLLAGLVVAYLHSRRPVFGCTPDGAIELMLQTLAFNAKVKIVKSPDYRVVAGALEIGAAWKRQSSPNKEYLSVKLDDPSFIAPVNARLVETENGTAPAASLAAAPLT